MTVVSDITLVGDSHALHDLGETHTFTATVTTDSPTPGTAIVGSTVTFEVIASPNVGLIATDVSDSGGQATFSYSSSVTGEDFVRASFVDNASRTQTSGNVPVEWANLNQPPTADANGPYSVAEGDSVVLTGSGSDPDRDPITFEWDFDGNNVSGEVGGTRGNETLQNPTYSAAGLGRGGVFGTTASSSRRGSDRRLRVATPAREISSRSVFTSLAC